MISNRAVASLRPYSFSMTTLYSPSSSIVTFAISRILRSSSCRMEMRPLELIGTLNLSHEVEGEGLPTTVHWKRTVSPSSTTLLVGRVWNFAAVVVDLAFCAARSCDTSSSTTTGTRAINKKIVVYLSPKSRSHLDRAEVDNLIWATCFSTVNSKVFPAVGVFDFLFLRALRETESRQFFAIQTSRIATVNIPLNG